MSLKTIDFRKFIGQIFQMVLETKLLSDIVIKAKNWSKTKVAHIFEAIIIFIFLKRVCYLSMASKLLKRRPCKLLFYRIFGGEYISIQYVTGYDLNCNKTFRYCCILQFHTVSILIFLRDKTNKQKKMLSKRYNSWLCSLSQ